MKIGALILSLCAILSNGCVFESKFDIDQVTTWIGGSDSGFQDEARLGPFYVAPTNGHIISATLIPDDHLFSTKNDNFNHITIEIYRRDADGGNLVTIASLSSLQTTWAAAESSSMLLNLSPGSLNIQTGQFLTRAAIEVESELGLVSAPPSWVSVAVEEQN